MKIAHIELSNKHKTLGKLQNIRDLEGGWAVLPFKQHPVIGLKLLLHQTQHYKLHKNKSLAEILNIVTLSLHKSIIQHQESKELKTIELKEI